MFFAWKYKDEVEKRLKAILCVLDPVVEVEEEKQEKSNPRKRKSSDECSSEEKKIKFQQTSKGN